MKNEEVVTIWDIPFLIDKKLDARKLDNIEKHKNSFASRNANAKQLFWTMYWKKEETQVSRNAKNKKKC